MTSPVVIGTFLAVVLVLIAGAMLWQEMRIRPDTEPPAFVVSDAVAFVWDTLDTERRTRLTRPGVKRIIEWDVYYLQGLAGQQHPVAGSEEAVAFVTEGIRTRHGVELASEDVGEVLALEVAYLEAIGVVGEPVEEEL